MTHLPPPGPELLQDAALFLDFDGTLVEIAEAPDAINVDAMLPQLLDRLRALLRGRIAIVTGRAIDDLERHLDCRGMAVAGSHGLELRLRDGARVPLVGSSRLAEARAPVIRLVEDEARLLLEEKPYSLAVHYRSAPALADMVQARMAVLAERFDLAVQHGKMVSELRPRGADKGDALRALMAGPDFAGARPIFIGDDLTDETAFAAAADLGGAGVLVGPERATQATWRLADVPAVADWLEDGARD